MKTKDLKNLRSKSLKELISAVEDKKRELIKLKADIATGNEKNLKRHKNLRREISQYLTLIKENEIMENRDIYEVKSSEKGEDEKETVKTS